MYFGSKDLTIGALVTVAILVLSLILIIGTDTSWGKVGSRA